MKIISEFNSLQEMNQYYCNSFSFDDSITFLGNSSQHSNVLLSLSEKVIQTVNNSESSFYIYQFSKTSFRKNIHPSLTNSVYKAFINSLKNNSYIIELSGSNVILREADLTQEVYDSFLSQISFDNFDSLDFLSKSSYNASISFKTSFTCLQSCSSIASSNILQYFPISVVKSSIIIFVSLL